MTMTKDAIKSTLNVVRIVADAIREAKEIPSGHLYATLMEYGMPLEVYQKIIDALKGAGLVEETPAHLLKWIEPKEASAATEAK